MTNIDELTLVYTKKTAINGQFAYQYARTKCNENYILATVQAAVTFTDKKRSEC